MAVSYGHLTKSVKNSISFTVISDDGDKASRTFSNLNFPAREFPQGGTHPSVTSGAAWTDFDTFYKAVMQKIFTPLFAMSQGTAYATKVTQIYDNSMVLPTLGKSDDEDSDIVNRYSLKDSTVDIVQTATITLYLRKLENTPSEEEDPIYRFTTRTIDIPFPILTEELQTLFDTFKAAATLDQNLTWYNDESAETVQALNFPVKQNQLFQPSSFYDSLNDTRPSGTTKNPEPWTCYKVTLKTLYGTETKYD